MSQDAPFELSATIGSQLESLVELRRAKLTISAEPRLLFSANFHAFSSKDYQDKAHLLRDIVSLPSLPFYKNPPNTLRRTPLAIQKGDSSSPLTNPSSGGGYSRLSIPKTSRM